MRRHKLDDLKKTYRFSLVEDESHETLKVVKFNKLQFILIAIVAVVVFMFLVYAIIAFTPIRRTIPGYPDAYSKQKALENAVKVDSLESAMTRWELYSSNLARVLSGEQTITLDSIAGTVSTNYLHEISQEEAARQDSILRARIDAENEFDISNASKKVLSIEGKHFYQPVSGKVINKYDKVKHKAVDVAAPAGAMVSAVLDGTVIYAGWNDVGGYSVVIQHESDIISVSTGNRSVLKRVGERVDAGTPVAIVGNTWPLPSEDHLHFELWNKGESVNPEKYIDFK